MLNARLESSVWLLLAVLGWPAITSAGEPAPVDFSLEYAAAPGCPTPVEFEAALRARLPSAQRVAQGASVAQIRVQLPGANAGEASQIRVSLPDGTSVRRELPEASCAEAVASMAVIAAMALEANGRAREASAAPESQSVTAADAPAPPVLPAPTVVSPPPVVVASTARLVSSPTAPAPRSTKAARSRWSALVSGGIESGVAPSVAPAVLAGLELASPASGALGPRVRLSGLFAERASERALHVAVSFRLLAARLDLCPNGLEHGRWSGTVCAELELGQLRGVATGVEHQQNQTMTWFGLGPAIQGRFALSPAFALQAAASGRVLPRHDDFTIGSDSVHQVPKFVLDFNFGLSASWR